MQPLCLVSTDTDWQQQLITGARELHRITDSNFHIVTPAPSIGIDAIRDLQRLLSRKPYGGGSRLIVLSGMEKATTEAQNALLKLLEEPPADTYIIITTTAEEAVLPTILSRCRSIRHASASDGESTPELQTVVKKILSARPGERILLAQEIAKTKEDTLVFLSSLIQLAQRQLHQSVIPSGTLLQWATILKHTEHARQYVERNVNFKATVDILFLGFPKVA